MPPCSTFTRACRPSASILRSAACACANSIAGRGVSSILPLGCCEQVFAGIPHDGMLVLSQLVDWKCA